MGPVGVGTPPYLLAARFLEPDILRALAAGATASTSTAALLRKLGGTP